MYDQHLLAASAQHRVGSPLPDSTDSRTCVKRHGSIPFGPLQYTSSCSVPQTITSHDFSDFRMRQHALSLTPRQARSESATNSLRQLHLLPIQQRITFKIAVFTFKALHEDLLPVYMQQPVRVYTPGDVFGHLTPMLYLSRDHAAKLATVRLLTQRQQCGTLCR